MPVRALTIALLVVGLAAVPAGAKTQRGLRAFTSCGQLLGYARVHAAKAVRTGWVPTPFSAASAPPGRMPNGKSAQPTAPQAAGAEDSASAGAGGAGETYSTTNVQEQGVDEPDVLKTDGKTLFAVANGVLHAVDVSGDEPKLLDTLTLDPGWGQELLLHGDRLLVVQSAWLDTETSARQEPSPPSDTPPPDGGSSGSGGGVSSGPVVAYPSGRAVTRLTEVDVSDPAKLRVVRNERDDGEYVSARMVGDTARLVLASRAPVMYAVADVAVAGGKARGAQSRASQDATIAKRLRQVRRAKLSAWQPHTFFRDHRKGHRTRFHALTRCREVRHSARFSGLDTITILTVDMANGLPSVDAQAIMSDAQIVYGAPDRLYVATQRWLAPQTMARPEAPPTVTQIHEFDTSSPDRTPYVATGEVDGYLLNQFAMSQYKGVLRVASTATPLWWGAGGDQGDGSAVTTFDTGTMQPLGRVGGLGKDEQIYAVRFIDDTGYVVTFRRIDPLYTIDLSHPGNPVVAGELKVAGYSAYLHPVGKDLLIGVGQDAGDDGRTNGTQVSLFDVADPSKPARLAKWAVGAGSSSTAEFDHHAFLYWPKTKLAVIPLAIYDYQPDGSGEPFVGAVGLHVDRDGIEEVGRVAHPADEYSLWTIQRSAVVGSRLFTLSDAGVLSSALTDLAAGPFVAFPDKPAYYGCGGPYPAQDDVAVSCPAYAR